ncbi:MAG TPA: alcohol dehydrogenase [Desulfobulbaceae bacterium]|nr:alcohol dehydrogenase [Desulfobulbaceae bacterium]
MNRFEACPKIFFGEDALDYLLELPPEKMLIVTDPYMVSSGTIKAVTSRLDRNSIEYTIFSEVEPDPSIETVTAGVQVIFRDKPHAIIALGGGSAIDAAKAVIYLCLRIKSGLMDQQYVHNPLFIAIPTTSGTGSEVTSYAVISDHQQGVKIPLSHRSMIPNVAILDPAFTKTLPKHLIAFTGMDVLTHAAEAYVSPMVNDFSNMFAAEAAAIALECLPALFADASDTEARGKMYSASTMAGLAFTNSGLGLCHGIAHTIGAQYHIPHGKANAIILPYVLRFNMDPARGAAQRLRERYARLAKRMGLIATGDAELCERLVLAVTKLGARLEVPASLSACDIPENTFMADLESNIDKILEDIGTKANPIPVTREDLRSLLPGIYHGSTRHTLHGYKR